MTTHPFDFPADARHGGNHHYPEGSEHEHYVFTFDNGRGAEVATDRDDADFWWLQPLVDGSPDPRHDGTQGLDTEDVAVNLRKIADWEPYIAAEPRAVHDDV